MAKYKINDSALAAGNYVDGLVAKRDTGVLHIADFMDQSTKIVTIPDVDTAALAAMKWLRTFDAEAGWTGFLDQIKPYTQQVLDDKPVAYWPLGEAAGPVVDIVGGRQSTYIGTSVTLGAAPIVVGDTTPSASFLGDAGVSRIELGDIFDFAGQVPFTIECWFNPTVDNQTVGLVSKHDKANISGWNMRLDLNRTRAGRAAGGSTSLTSTTGAGTGVLTGAAGHAAYIFDGTTHRVYQSGKIASAASLVGQPQQTIADTAIPLMIGVINGSYENRFAGRIGHVAIYDYAVPSYRLALHYTSGTVGP